MEKKDYILYDCCRLRTLKWLAVLLQITRGNMAWSSGLAGLSPFHLYAFYFQCKVLYMHKDETKWQQVLEIKKKLQNKWVGAVFLSCVCLIFRPVVPIYLYFASEYKPQRSHLKGSKKARLEIIFCLVSPCILISCPF